MTENALSIAPASRAEAPLVGRLLQLCLHEISEWMPPETGPGSVFAYPWLPLYWTSPHRHPYLFRSGDEIIGFALVRSKEDDGAGCLVSRVALAPIAATEIHDILATLTARDVELRVLPCSGNSAMRSSPRRWRIPLSGCETRGHAPGRRRTRRAHYDDPIAQTVFQRMTPA
ncbi:MAG: hypothetical protein ACREH8_01750 [Opitutaceae bacterium]